jgi:hypothetical protein
MNSFSLIFVCPFYIVFDPAEVLRSANLTLFCAEYHRLMIGKFSVVADV